MNHTLIKDWTTKAGLRAVVLEMHHNLGFQQFNGYVAVTKEHPFFGKYYNEQVDCITQEMASSQIRGKKGVMIVLTAQCNSDGEGLVRRSPNIVIDVHGGLTYSQGESLEYPANRTEDEWFFGFDTAHSEDFSNPKSLEYVINECESMAEQLKSFTK